MSTGNASGALIEARGLTKHYDGFSLEGVDLTVNEGEVVGFIGQNGAGKSTTIKALLGLFPVDGGTSSVLGVPTVNLALPPEMALPPYGVYATRVLVGDKGYVAATNIGVKPTFRDGGAPTIEPHLLDFAGDLYGRMIHVELHKFLRPEMRFDSAEALRAAIDENIRQTREFFAKA